MYRKIKLEDLEIYNNFEKKAGKLENIVNFCRPFLLSLVVLKSLLDPTVEIQIRELTENGECKLCEGTGWVEEMIELDQYVPKRCLCSLLKIEE